MQNIDKPVLLKEWKFNLNKSAHDFFGLWWWKTIIKEKIDSLVIIVGNGMILLPARNNTYSQDHERTLQASKSLLRVLSTFKINILYDNDDVIEGLRIKCINFNKVFGYE